MSKNRKLLLIKPPYGHIPIGMAYVMGLFKKEGIPFDFHDMYIDLKKDLKEVIKKEDYFCVATGGLIGSFNIIKKITLESKKLKANIPVILGGGITNDVAPELLFKILPIDYAVIGEAETSLPDLLRVIQQENDENINKYKDLNNCRGLIFKDPQNGMIVRKNPIRLDFNKEDPRPLYDYIDVEYYLNHWDHTTWGKMKAMPILTGRGCKGRCSFCSPTLGRFRKRKYENVLNEIEEYKKSYDPDAFMFINEILYESSDEIIEFCKKYKELPNIKPWLCLLRADIDPKVFPYMKESGCFAINIGIESGSDRILRKMHKGVNLNQIIRIIRELKKSDFIVEFSFMMANESETEEDLKTTIDLIINEEIVFQTLGLTIAYPGTTIYKNALSRGLISNEEEYISKLKFGYNPNNPNLASLFYLNVSGISDNLLWKTVFIQYRRYSSYLYKKFTVKNLKIKIDDYFDLVTMTGNCPQCGNIISTDDIYSQQFLNLKKKCTECYALVYFNPYKDEKYKKHYHNLKKAISNAEKVIINSTNGNAYALFLYDMLDIPAEKIKGFLEKAPEFINNPYFYFPRFDSKNEAKLSTSFTIINTEFAWKENQINIYLDKTARKSLLSLTQLSKNASICIYGSGSFARKFYAFISETRKDVKICCFIDSFKNGLIDGKDIIKFDDFIGQNIPFDAIVIASTYYIEILPQLCKNKIDKIIIMRPNEFVY